MRKRLFFAGAFIIFSCLRVFAQPVAHKVEYLIVGSYAGECDGHCATMYKITNSALYIDTTDSYFKGGGGDRPIRFPDRPSPLNQFQLLVPLLRQIPERLFTTDTFVWGCPDCADQGGYYVEFKYDGKAARVFHIDILGEGGFVPKDLSSFTNQFMGAIKKLAGIK
jgi:hypothetical protein